MKNINNIGLAALSGLAALLFGVLAVASAFRRDGAIALGLFSFAYIMYDVARGFIKESKEE